MSLDLSSSLGYINSEIPNFDEKSKKEAEVFRKKKKVTLKLL